MKYLLCLSFLFLSFGAIADELRIPIDLIVLQETDGTGNELWAHDNAFVDRVLDRINHRFFETDRAEFYVAEKQVLQDSRLYNTSQHDLLKRYVGQRQKGRILVVVSNERMIDSHGLGRKQAVVYDPVIIMRGAFQDPQNPATHIPDYKGSDLHVNQEAGLFRHELGHQMNYFHIVDNPAVNTDNYTSLPDQRDRWETYLVHLANELGH